MKKTLTLLFITLIFFGCKKDNKESIANQKSEIITTSEAKAFLGSLSHRKTESTNDSDFNPASLLEKIDWENASTIDSGKALIGATSGQPIENGTKIGFRKSVFFKDSLGKVDMIIYEFVPDIYHLWKYKGIKKDSFDGKVFVYDKNYHLTKGYLYKSGIAIGEIVPTFISTTQQTAIRKTEALVYSCSSNVEVYLNGGGYYEAYFILTCNSYYVPSSYIGNTSKFEEVLDGGGGGGVGTGNGITPVPIPTPIFPNIESPKIQNVKDYIKCFGINNSTASSYKLTVYVQEPLSGSGSSIIPSSFGGYGVGHAFIGIAKNNTSQIIGFYPSGGSIGAGISTVSGNNVYSELHDNGQTEYTISQSYSLTSAEFINMINFVDSFNPNIYTYNLFNHNCTSFVFDAASAAGINLPNSGNGYLIDKSPAQLGQDMRNSGQANNNSGNAPLSNGPCN